MGYNPSCGPHLVAQIFFCHLPHISCHLLVSRSLATLEISLVSELLMIVSQISISITFILVPAILIQISITSFMEITARAPITALIGFTLLTVKALRAISSISVISVAIARPVAPTLAVTSCPSSTWRLPRKLSRR